MEAQITSLTNRVQFNRVSLLHRLFAIVKVTFVSPRSAYELIVGRKYISKRSGCESAECTIEIVQMVGDKTLSAVFLYDGTLWAMSALPLVAATHKAIV